jgi:hypothetical protein
VIHNAEKALEEVISIRRSIISRNLCFVIFIHFFILSACGDEGGNEPSENADGASSMPVGNLM